MSCYSRHVLALPPASSTPPCHLEDRLQGGWWGAGVARPRSGVGRGAGAAFPPRLPRCTLWASLCHRLSVRPVFTSQCKMGGGGLCFPRLTARQCCYEEILTRCTQGEPGDLCFQSSPYPHSTWWAGAVGLLRGVEAQGYKFHSDSDLSSVLIYLLQKALLD